MDLISRQAAIDALTEYGSEDSIYMSVGELKRRIEALPSAQSEIVRCKDCKHWEGERRGQFYYFEQCSLHERTASSDDFCSWAERREE